MSRRWFLEQICRNKFTGDDNKSHSPAGAVPQHIKVQKYESTYPFHFGFAGLAATAPSAGNSTRQRIPPGIDALRFFISRRTPNIPLAASKTLSTTVTCAE